MTHHLKIRDESCLYLYLLHQAMDQAAQRAKMLHCEHMYWGDSESNPIADPNPRREMLIEAARLGSQVSALLDSFFDDGKISHKVNREAILFVDHPAVYDRLL